MKTVILTSRQNFVWGSMEEIIPAIENQWQSLQETSTTLFNVDVTSLSEILPFALQADHIVLTCFNSRIGHYARILRERCHIDAKFIIHLHNQSTIACWPLLEFGLNNLLKENDTFISSCERDRNALALTFPDGNCKVVRFTVEPLIGNEFGQPRAINRDTVPFVYVGRISEQKNLHTLIYSFFLLRQENPNLDFHLSLFGAEDQLGSPNMGMSGGGYLDFLKNLCNLLELNKYVTFEGHKERESLYTSLKHMKHIFVSASLHSDENFGMAAFRALAQGNPAVLSDWGGHADFFADFEAQLKLVPVLKTPTGPCINPRHFSAALQNAATIYTQPCKTGIPSQFSHATIIQQLAKSLEVRSGNPPPLLPSHLALSILEKRRARTPKSDSTPIVCKIFESYSDVLAQPFFEAYGMRPSVQENESPQRICPWVTSNSQAIHVNDPHRGKYLIEQTDISNPKKVLYHSNGSSISCDSRQFDLLERNGYLHL